MFSLATLRTALAVRVDSWANQLINVGTALGKTDFRFRLSGGEFLSLVDLGNLYDYDGIAARIVDAVPKHALRQGVTVSTGDAAEETAITDALAALHLVETTRLAWTWGRAFGGGALYLGCDDGRAPDEPLDERNLRSVDWVTDIDRRDLMPMTWEHGGKNFGKPRLYRLTRMGGTETESVTVHASRIVRFEGTSPTRRRRLQLQGWGDSVLQRVYAELQAARAAFAASGVLLQEASQGVLKIKDLMSMMASDTDDTIKRRLELMNASRSNANALLLDADGESFERVEVGALTGVVDVMDRMMNMVSATSGIPVTVLMGQAPAGLNATGDADIRSWYDEVSSERTQMLDPKLRRVIGLVLRSKDGPTGGREPKGWKTVWPSLWQMTPTEQADLRNKQANTDALYIDRQVLTSEEVATSRFRREGWSDDTSIDLGAREAAMQADRDAADATKDQGADAPGADHAQAAGDIIERVASRAISRESGVALLASSLGMAADDAEAAMGESGRTHFTTPDPAAVDELAALRAENAKLKASNQGHKAYTARVVAAAKDGSLQLGKFTAQAPTETAEGDVLEAGDVVAVPVEDDRLAVRRMDGGTHDGVAVVLRLPRELASKAPASVECAPDLHVTLCYLGKLSALRPGTTDQILEAVRQWSETTAPIAATLGGIGRFAGAPEGDPVYVPVDSEGITDTRPALVQLLRDVARVEPAKGHGFTPHMTLAYVGALEPTPDPVAPFAVEFDRVSVWFGDVQRDFDLTGGE